MCVYSRDTDELTVRSEDSKQVHVPLYLLPDYLKPSKRVIESWDPYAAGDISTQILRDFQPTSNAHHLASRATDNQSPISTGVTSQPIAELIRQEFEVLRQAPSYGTQPH